MGYCTQLHVVVVNYSDENDFTMHHTKHNEPDEICIYYLFYYKLCC